MRGVKLPAAAGRAEPEPADDAPDGRRCADAVWQVLADSGQPMERGEIIKWVSELATTGWDRDKPFSIRAVTNALGALTASGRITRLPGRDGVYQVTNTQPSRGDQDQGHMTPWGHIPPDQRHVTSNGHQLVPLAMLQRPRVRHAASACSADAGRRRASAASRPRWCSWRLSRIVAHRRRVLAVIAAAAQLRRSSGLTGAEACGVAGVGGPASSLAGELGIMISTLPRRPPGAGARGATSSRAACRLSRSTSACHRPFPAWRQVRCRGDAACRRGAGAGRLMQQVIGLPAACATEPGAAGHREGCHPAP